ncbi:cytochrome P450 [Ganoderma sinense ZZ0214-1]|uniref:Cytochrome P450 n=1 Tax=Ganoderma sinense ZZ0214-1 TaxID=1077348 RepID=A0A2G8S2H2_9APHY|nr:cytochrome P450 [Ganoderma sinense ZZ0214-1]
MDDYKSLAFALLAAGIATYAVRWYTDPLRAIPTVGGSSLPGLSWLAALRMLRNGKAVVEEGYRKYPERTFKLPALDRWLVVVSGRELVEELRKRGEEELSAPESLKEISQAKYIFDPLIVTDQYHVKVLQEKLTRRLPELLLDIVDEVMAAVQDHIVSREDEWTSVEVIPVMQNIIARASNRAFVGLPLCRNEEYLRLAVGIVVDTVKTMIVLSLVPRFLKSTVARFYNKVQRNTELAVQHFRPIIEERQRIAAQRGERWDNKPNDLLQFILDKAKSNNDTISTIAQRVLGLNFAAIHTTSTVTHMLTRLAEHPELLAPLRDEIEESIAAEGGWTSVALANMWMLDSLLRETLRFHGIGLLGMGRKAMKDLTLCDGTFLPRGTIVHTAAHALHHDSAVLERADTFDAFRYARMRAAAVRSGSDQGTGAKLQFAATTTSPEYLPFGHGAHACPGRYFADNVLKAVLAHLILKYDMKLGGDGVRPADVFIAMGVLPAPQSRVLFRPRKCGGDPGQ